MRFLDHKPQELIGKVVAYGIAFDRNGRLDTRIYRAKIVKTTRKDIWIDKSKIVFDYDGNQKLKQSKTLNTMIAYIMLVDSKEELELIRIIKLRAQNKYVLQSLEQQAIEINTKIYELRK
jgi:hypothetical protein